jgi:hypothetical protein
MFGECGAAPWEQTTTRLPAASGVPETAARPQTIAEDIVFLPFFYSKSMQ